MADGSGNEIKEFGQKLRDIRKSQNYSMEELANMAELEPVQVHRIETGKTNPKLSTVYALAKALNVSPKEFF
ncbi:helix-turn-helix domain-containing protein [Mucilaginibacter pedocola]|uniref:HTH cro/C1-type domain-containing protein n=1 Tax=Mucilaginibacter pedocola TaxID=1792845 RepID=A0A1S9P8R0_9SPHI|nr:helix-turn-helix transcriptional regulator [Mucilaginibacter pedocola]OOQ57356.1 hypothetical protein BC343_14725 [Mucilaginibacter pedocola]